MEAVLDTFERVLGRDHPFLADPMTGLGEVALAERRAGRRASAARTRVGDPVDAHGRRRRRANRRRSAWRKRSGTPSPADRRHALELAAEARDGYAGDARLAHRLALVDRWLAAPSPRRAPDVVAPKIGSPRTGP